MSIKGMNNLIEKTGTPRSLVYVGGKAMMVFPTNQQAWQYLNELFKTSVEEETSWPEEVYVACMLEEVGKTLLVPQIDKAVILDGQLKYRGLFGTAFSEFQQRIVDDWPTIKKGLSDG
jgi:hypothetical protein